MKWPIKIEFVFLSIEIVIVFLLLSCAPPDGGAWSGGSSREISIACLKSFYRGHPITVTGDYSIRGEVVSTDRYVNFYKSLVISDHSGGIEIKLDMENIYRVFCYGHQVRVHCNGLTLGAYGDLIQLGGAPAGEFQTGYIDENIITVHLKAIDRGMVVPEPSRLTIDGLSPHNLSCLVRMDDVQFIEEERGLLWCDMDCDTDRHIIDRDGNVLKVRTSRHALFASQLLPHGSGYIEGIVSYFNGEYQLRVADPRMVVMNGERF